MDTFARDVRYALTTLRRTPGFAAAALLTLALGIGATTAVFSVVYGVLLRPLPYPNADRLVNLSEERPGATSPLPVPMLSNLTYHAWSDSSSTVDVFAAYSGRQYTIELPDGVARIDGAAVTPTLFALLGTAPAMGRFFGPTETVAGGDAVLVLSDRLWRQRFHAEPGIVGRSILVDGKPYAIVGVAPPSFAFPARDTMLWTPYLVAAPAEGAVAGGRGALSVLRAIGRLKPGAAAIQAEAEGTAAARRYPRPMADQLLFGSGTAATIAHVKTMRDELTATIRPALVVLAAAVVLVLLIACANVANLFLSRGVARRRELTVRAAIGASRARLVRQLLTESLVLSVLGGGLGLALAELLVTAGPRFATRNFPRLDAIVIDARTIAFATAATMATAVICGLAPALRAARIDLNDALHGGDGATAGGFRGAGGRRLRQVLLGAEATFAVLLVVGAMLLGRSFVKLTHVDAGYTAENVLAAEVFVPGYDAAEVLSPNGSAKAEHIASVVERSLERVRGTGGVLAAGAGNMMPLDNATQIAGFPAPWTPDGGRPATARALQYTITPGYAETLQLRLKAGRIFTDADRAGGVRSWIVNEEFARLYLPPNPVGYRFEQRPASGPITIEIVGVVGNVLKNGNNSKPQPEYYRMPRDQTRFYGRFQIAVRTLGDPALVAPTVRNIVRELEPSAAVETTTLATRVQASVEQPRFAMAVLASFAGLALVLASIGLYGVLSYSVAQRRREMGVRAALGAARGDLVRLVIADGLGVTAVGVVLGLAGAAALTRLMRNVLFGVAPLDAVSFSIAPIMLLSVALLAAWLPARRAAATDPAEALRCE
jgi:putative ABC transport system permease protein